LVGKTWFPEVAVDTMTGFMGRRVEGESRKDQDTAASLLLRLRWRRAAWDIAYPPQMP